MNATSLAYNMRDWAITEDKNDQPWSLDRQAPHTLTALQLALSRPLHINAVERIESLAKNLWTDTLEPTSYSAPIGELLEFTRFFSDLGFFYKYKPYGVKVASPFGYSLFDLKAGQGFSFQVHTEPKLEGFHILRAKESAIAYLSSRAEWESTGAVWARSFTDGSFTTTSSYIFEPRPGDIMSILETDVVHSVLGCTIEEFASCSVDAVERLYDQNLRSDLALPSHHPSLVGIFEQCYSGPPMRRLERKGESWVVADVVENEGIIATGDLWGGRRFISPDKPLTLHDEERLVVVVAADAALRVALPNTSRHMMRGEMTCIPPGLDATIYPIEGSCTASIQYVSTSLILSDWSR